MKSYESFMQEVDEEVLQENPLRWFKNLIKGAGKALVPAGIAAGSGIVGGAKDLVGRAINPKDKSAPTVHGKKMRGPARSK